MPEEFVPAIEPARVSAQEPFHPCDQIGLRRLHHEVEVVGHQAIGMNLPTRLGTCFSQCGEEPLAIGVVLENSLSTVATVHDVIDRTRILDSQLAGHSGSM